MQQIKRESDIAIRNVRPSSPDLITRKLMDGEGRMYATKEYIASLGQASVTPDALRQATFINFHPAHNVVSKGNPEYLKVAPFRNPILTNSELVGWDMVKKGLGITIMLDKIGDEEPLVERVLPDFPPLHFELWIVVHRELRNTPRLRLVFDQIVEAFSKLQV